MLFVHSVLLKLGFRLGPDLVILSVARAGAELKKIELVRTFTLFLVQFELKLEAARLALSSVHGEPN